MKSSCSGRSFFHSNMHIFKYLHGELTLAYSVGLHQFRLRIVYDRDAKTLVDADITCKSGWRILTGTEFTASKNFVDGLDVERNYSSLGLSKSLFKPAWTDED